MTSVSPSLDIYSVTTAVINLNKLSILIQIEDTEERSVETLGLIDSGAGGKFIDQTMPKEWDSRPTNWRNPYKLTMWMEPRTNEEQSNIMSTSIWK